MTFFLTNPPSDESPNDEATSPRSNAAKSRPLFKQDDALPDTLAGEHISLSAYISKHLHGADSDKETEETPESVTKGSSFGFPTPEIRTSHSGKTGLFLNSLDVEMASGLEQYLPSPIFRLRIAKKRIDGEINELRLRLNKYERLPERAPALQEQIIILKQRLASLEKHQHEINQQLAADLSMVPKLYALTKQGRGLGELLNAWLAKLRQFLLTLFYGRAYLDVQAEGDELVYLKELYAERLKSGTCAESELSAIINRFEQVMQRAEGDAHKLKPNSFPKRLWQEVKGLVK